MKGYSIAFKEKSDAADGKNPGVQFGRFCIKQGISVNEVAEHFNVTRMAVYKWFRGDVTPPKYRVEEFQRFMEARK